jgi:hypothetical protein
MSARKKTRKNAGEGYGYMFHGSFGTKEKAQAKERKTKGAWIKHTLTNKGWRYLVMSPRTNPIKRKKKNPSAVVHKHFAPHTGWGPGAAEKAYAYADKMRAKYPGRKVDIQERTSGAWDVYVLNEPATNPHELLIMGANPHGEERQQEISLPPGSTILIRTPRTNPVVNPGPNPLFSFHPGLLPQHVRERTLGRRKRVSWDRMKPAKRRLVALAAGVSESLADTWSRIKWRDIPEGWRDALISHLGAQRNQIFLNPGPDDNYMIQAAVELFGKQLKDLSSREMSKVAMRAAQLKRAHTAPRPNVELGTYENGVFHPWTRRPKSRQKKAIRRQNPDAAGIREDFTGLPVDREQVRQEPHMPAGDYAQLGKLLTLAVKPRTGGQVLDIRSNALIVSDERAQAEEGKLGPIWFVGGDQDVSAALPQFGTIERRGGIYELGEAREIHYEQRKEHVPHPEQDHWRHRFGEETNERPTVLYDAPHKRLLLEGGAYRIRREGIVN